MILNVTGRVRGIMNKHPCTVYYYILSMQAKKTKIQILLAFTEV